MNLRRFIEEKWVKMAKSTSFWAELVSGTDTKSWYQYPLCRGEVVLIPLKVVPVPIDRRGLVSVIVVSGTSTHLQNRIGIGTDQSGTGTDASSNTVFISLALLSLIFVH